MRYPAARRSRVIDALHGHVVPDPYRWLENPASAETRRWRAAQDELWRRHAATLPDRERLHARVASLSETGLVTAPTWRGDRRFFLRQRPGQEHAVLYTVLDGAPPGGAEQVLAERVLVDPMGLDPRGLTTLDRWQPDLEGRLLAYQVSRRGDELSELYVLDVATRQIVDGPIARCRYSPVAWLPGGTAFYYVRTVPGRPAHHRRVYLHRVGAPAAEDVAVFGTGGATSYGLATSHDGRWLVITTSPDSAPPGNDIWLADLASSRPQTPRLRTVQEGVAAQTELNIARDGRLYIATTLGSPRGRICVADPAHPGPEGWRELVGADPGGAVLSGFTVLDGPQLARPHLLAGWTRHAIGEISVHDTATGERLGTVPLPGPGTVGSLTTRAADSHEVWFSYTDSVTPVAVYRYDARTGASSLWESSPGGVELPDIQANRFIYTSADGTPVHMVVLAQPAPGPRPTILYGYGGFGRSLTPQYSSFALAWVEAGGVFATANLRGGGEEGEQWHRAGMLEHKQNTFDDFFAAAEKLIADGWTTPEQLGICGESNGGLLVGAAITQRPELFAAAVCSAPLLDMARYERFGRGASWRAEYGSAADPEQLRHLLAYSPYHNVRAGTDYPAVLFTVSDGDSRVDPLHARKMCAALQAATAGERPILIRDETDVGHGARSTSRAVGLAADMLAFLGGATRS